VSGIAQRTGKADNRRSGGNSVAFLTYFQRSMTVMPTQKHAAATANTAADPALVAMPPASAGPIARAAL
jgi:hypothetical protein